MSRARPHRARIATLAASVLALTLIATACQTGVTMWSRCDPHAPGGEFGTDRSYVLHCRDGIWHPLMTVDEYLRASGGERLTPAPVPTRPTPAPTTTVPPVATLDVDFTPGPGTLLGDYTAGQCALDEWDEPDPSRVSRESAQSFTAGKSGTITRVALALTEIGDATPLRIAIRAMVGGSPGGPVLGSATYDGPGSPDARTMTQIDLSTSAPVVAGTTYAVEVTTASCSLDGWWQVSMGMNGYSGGIAFVRAPGSGWGADSGADMFVQTWVR